jgi:urocanate hydratase
MGGVARRAWAGNRNSIETSVAYNELRRDSDHITLPFMADEEMVAERVSDAFENRDK